MKKLLALILVLVLCAFTALAEEAAAEETVDAVVEDAAEEAVPTSIITGTPLGLWDSYGYDGDSSMALRGKFYYLPGNIVDDGTVAIAAEVVDDTHFTVTLPEGDPIAAELSEVTPAICEQYGIGEELVGEPCVILTVKGMDNSNPLAPVEMSTTTLFLKYSYQYYFLQKIMAGKIWKIGDNTLTIDAEGNMDLNGGAAAGSANWTYDDEQELIVRFEWNTGARIRYIPTAIDESSITLMNQENPDEVITLELQGDAPAAEAEAEAEPAA